MAAEPSLWRFTVTDYHRMAEAGILTEDDRVELIDGEIIQMSPIGGQHVDCVSRLNELLVDRRGTRFRVNIQSPVRLSGYHEPEPDVAVVRVRDYAGELPTPADVLLLIEVADTTLRYDRTTKVPMYAGAGIPEVWIVDVQGEVIERYTDRVQDTYRTVTRFERGQDIESIAVSGLVLRVDDVLG